MSERESTKVIVTFLKAMITRIISIESLFTSSFRFNNVCSFNSFFTFENARQHLWSSLKPQEGVFTEVLLFFYFCNGVVKPPAWVITIKNFQWTGLMFSRSIWLYFNRQQKLMNITREWILKRHFLWTINIWNVLETSWRRQWHPIPVLLSGESHGQRSLVGCGPWDREESDTTEQLYFHFSLSCIGEGNGNPLQCSCWQPTPVFLPGESQVWGSLVGCRLWGRTESDMTEAT